MKVLYFAWLRSRIGVAEEEVPAAGIATLRDLVEHLRRQSTAHADALANLKVVRAAVNQEFAELDHPLRPGDEVALFPPVTGG